jgi:hypothetical protein
MDGKSPFTGALLSMAFFWPQFNKDKKDHLNL